MNIKTIGVIGAGTMGNGIAHVFAKSGFQVYLQDIDQRFLDRALDSIKKNLERELAKQKITADARDAAIKAISPVTERAVLAKCDFIVEAASEKLEIKREIFEDLDK